MQWHLTKTTDRSHDEWDLEWTNRNIRTQHQEEGVTHPEQTVAYESRAAAFQAYRQWLLERLKEGYTDGAGNLRAEDLTEATFHTYLREQQYDLAEVWLKRHQAIEDERYENALLQTYLEHKAYSEAEKYILRQLQGEDNLNRVMRQIRYLTQVNPLLGRFMIGNLLQQELGPQIHLGQYYRDLAMAQSAVGMFEHLNSTLTRIEVPTLQLTYLGHLLHTHQPESAQQQMEALEKARHLLKHATVSPEDQQEFYDLLIEGATRIQQPQVAVQLREQRPSLPVEE